MPRRTERWSTKSRKPLTTPLTARQAETVYAIERFTKMHGYSPTTREIGDMLDVNQTAASNLVAACVRKGKLKRIAGKARTITIVEVSA